LFYERELVLILESLLGYGRRPKIPRGVRRESRASASCGVCHEADAPVSGSYTDHKHATIREALGLSEEFVVHSLRHTMLTRLGEAGADVFSIMRIAGHSSVTVSERYVHPSPESLERSFEKLENLNSVHFLSAAEEARAEAAGGQKLPPISTIANKKPHKKSSQVIVINNAGP
jgi:hypothetical protein